MENALSLDAELPTPKLNGDHTVHNDANDVKPTLNGVHDASIDVKDVPMVETQHDDAVVPQTGLSDVSMGDVTDGDVNTPATTPGMHDAASSSFLGSVNGTSTYTTPSDPPLDMDDDKPPPAKRPRVHSDADMASRTHSHSPPPPSAVTSNGATPVPPPPSTFTPAQYRFCQSTIRSLKKMKDAVPFLRPVDPVALNLPTYTTVVKNPMDFSTVERKLNSSNPIKPDLNPDNPRYLSPDDFVNDVRLIFSNCITFNGPEHTISQMGRRVEEVFDKQIKNIPPAAEAPPVKKVSTPPPPPPPVVPPAAKKVQPRRASTSMPVIRRSDTEAVGRPKREIHPPPPKDLPYADAPKRKRQVRRAKDNGVAEQLKFCGKILTEMYRKQHIRTAGPFYEPVDWQTLDLPDYPKIVKKPMDLSTMRRKLDNGEYPGPDKFYDDFRLMIRNCFMFNPAGTPVNQAGIELQQLFDDRWKNLPPLRPDVSEDEDEDEDESEDERTRTIAMMETQMETLRNSISALKNSKPAKEKKKKEKVSKSSASTSLKAAHAPKPQKVPGKKKSKPAVANDDVLTFEQKKHLSDAIGNLDGAKLEKVIQMIHDAVPEIKDSNEEIELEIDTLPPSVLTKLYHFVIRPKQPARKRPGKGTGTGGLKRKSMDEEVEAEKIRKLEQRMKLFDQQGANGGFSMPLPTGDDSDASSDSNSSDDSSGSDSD